MAKKDKGYVLVWRSLQDNWIWTSNQPFDCRSAWIDLILLVNHEDRKVQIGANCITVHKGQYLTSLVKLAERWHWSRDRVRRYLKMLEKDGMIIKDSTRVATLITLVNYGNFTWSSNTNKSTNNTTNNATSKPSSTTQTIHYNELNTLKEIKRAAPPSDGGEWQ